jgi:hypothetical protein
MRNAKTDVGLAVWIFWFVIPSSSVLRHSVGAGI